VESDPIHHDRKAMLDIMKTFPGLICGEQNPVGPAQPYWQYGNIVNGTKQIDPVLHFGCFVLGFQRTDIIDYVCEHMKIKPEVAESFYCDDTLKLNDITWSLAERIHGMTGFNSIFALSGSDANEGAVKLASAYQKQMGQTKRYRIVSFEDSYHGSTFLNYSMGDSMLKDPFYTLRPYDSVKRLPRDFAVSEHDWSDVMCVIVETCPYGDGLKPSSADFWSKIKEIQQQGVLVIVDDIFIGGGKTGTVFGWQTLPITPDITTQGKAITAGYFPLSITMYNKRIAEALPDKFNWDHGFTYSFSLPGILSCNKYLDILEQENILQQHQSVIAKAHAIFAAQDYKVLGEYGTILQIKRKKDKHFLVLPINATDEYFSVLEEHLR
jgi:adenosylmethionine-8-amino-7-oxononanoate aminotransferase